MKHYILDSTNEPSELVNQDQLDARIMYGTTSIFSLNESQVKPV